MKKTITIFGSSKPSGGEAQYRTAYNIAKKLALKGFNICSGGFNGIMEAVSKAAVEVGAQAIGVTVDLWGADANRFVTKEIKCSSLLERINKLIEFGDGFVVLQGGTGTLVELAVVWESINKGLMRTKPVVCHSVLWKKIVAEMNNQMQLEERSTDLVKTFDTEDEIVDYLSKTI